MGAGNLSGDSEGNTFRALPPEDEARLMALSPHQVQHATLQLIQEYRAKIKAFESYIHQAIDIYNAFAPIHLVLPDEILFEIFRVARPSSPRHIRLTHVCRAWRSIIHNTPDFWADFLGAPGLILAPSDKHSPFLQTVIDRSAHRMYALTISCTNLELLNALPSHVSRLSSLTLKFQSGHGGGHLQQFHSFLRLPMLTLASLTLELPCGYAHSAQRTNSWLFRDVVAEQFPRLATLRTHCALLTPSLALKSLRHVTFMSCHDEAETVLDMGPCCGIQSMEQLKVYLEECPNLETLELRNCLPYVNHPGDVTRPAVRLPECLRSCVVRHSTDAAHIFLQHFVLPHAAHFSFYGYSSNASTTFEFMLPPAVALKSIPSIQGVSLTVSTKEPCSLRAHGDVHERLSLSTDDPRRFIPRARDEHWPTKSVLDSTARIFAHSSTLTHLDLTSHIRDFVNVEVWQLLTSRLTYLTSLSVTLEHDGADLFRALSGSHSVQSCPVLVEFAVTRSIYVPVDESNYETIFSSIQSRYDTHYPLLRSLSIATRSRGVALIPDIAPPDSLRALLRRFTALAAKVSISDANYGISLVS